MPAAARAGGTCVSFAPEGADKDRGLPSQVDRGNPVDRCTPRALVTTKASTAGS
jgi:hypothetical protein